MFERKKNVQFKQERTICQELYFCWLLKKAAKWAEQSKQRGAHNLWYSYVLLQLYMSLVWWIVSFIKNAGFCQQFLRKCENSYACLHF